MDPITMTRYDRRLHGRSTSHVLIVAGQRGDTYRLRAYIAPDRVLVCELQRDNKLGSTDKHRAQIHQLCHFPTG